MRIVTHRGLESSRTSFFSESSYEAFQEHLARGFGVECDLCFLADREIAISHDATLTRLSGGRDNRPFAELTLDDIHKIRLPRGRMTDFSELMRLVASSTSQTNFLHFKAKDQNSRNIETLCAKYGELEHSLKKQLVIFDVLPHTAEQLKNHIPDIVLAPSVAHPYDIKRYNSAVNGSLLTIEDAFKYQKKGLYDWVWLDEWDLADEHRKVKKLYTAQTFVTLQSVGYLIALVTPELHETSPGLLGGEVHEDAKTKERLFKRIEEIVSLHPDAICTDYPEEVRTISAKILS